MTTKVRVVHVDTKYHGNEGSVWFKQQGATFGDDGRFIPGSDQHETVLIEGPWHDPMYLPVCTCGATGGRWYAARSRYEQAGRFTAHHARELARPIRA